MTEYHFVKFQKMRRLTVKQLGPQHKLPRKHPGLGTNQII